MLNRIISSVFLALLFTALVSAQSPSDKPVWTLELIKVKPGMFGFAMGYLDDNWMRVRDVAKRQGAVLSYNRIAEGGSTKNEGNIVLLTEFKNQSVFEARTELFNSIQKQLSKPASGLIRPPRQEDLYELISTRVFQDYSEVSKGQLRPLAADF